MVTRVFDRLPEFDARSLEFPIRTVLVDAGIKKHRSYSWSCGQHLDQGQEGACVGFAWSHELTARPAVWPGVTVAQARMIYKQAQRIDQWPGESYSGTSVIAGAKVCQKQLLSMVEYRWVQNLNDLILAVGYTGPAVLGVNWYTGMFDTDDEGFIHPTGDLAGGHAILCKGVSVRGKYFILHNSWGPDWGVHGDAYISFEDMEGLLSQDGEACIPIRRLQPAK